MTSVTITSPAAAVAGARRAVAFWPVLALVLLADALDLIDSTVTNIAAPTIVADIGGGPALIKWLGAAYALALGVLLVVGGRLGDKYGQRRMFIVGIAGFTAASAVCGVAPDPAVLIAARAVQGAFGALLIPQGMAILTKAFDRDQQQKAFGLFGPLLGLSTVAGPVLAGFIIDQDIAGLSWRPIFLVNVVLGAIGLVAALRVLPHDDGDGETVVDTIGSTLLGGAMLGLIFGLIQGSSDGWTTLSIASLLAGAACFGGFARRQVTAADPLIKPTLLANRGFTSGLLIGLMYFAVVSGLAYIMSLFMQQVLGADPGEAALGLLPLSLGIIVAAGGAMGLGLAQKHGRTLVQIGMLVTLAGAGGLLAIIATAGAGATLWGLSPAVFVVGLGMGLCFGTIFDIALGDIAPDEAGGASGSLSAVQQLSAGIGSAVVTTVYLAGSSATGSMILALAIVLVVTAACLPATRLLPRNAPPEEVLHGG